MKHIGWSSKDFRVYSGSARFESQQGPHSSCRSFLWLFWPHQLNITLFWLSNDCLLLYPLNSLATDYPTIQRSQNSVCSILNIGWGKPSRGKKCLSSPKYSDQPWGPTTLLFKRYWGFSSRGEVAKMWNWPLTSI